MAKLVNKLNLIQPLTYKSELGYFIPQAGDIYSAAQIAAQVSQSDDESGWEKIDNNTYLVYQGAGRNVVEFYPLNGNRFAVVRC